MDSKLNPIRRNPFISMFNELYLLLQVWSTSQSKLSQLKIMNILLDFIWRSV